MQNAERRHFFNNKYFQIGASKQPVHNVSLKKPYFYKGNTLSKRFRGQVPRAQIQVCVSAKLSSWLGEGAICDFWPFLLLPHFSSEMPIFIVRKGAVPEPPFRVDPEPPRFLKKRGPPGSRPAYIYMYAYIYIWIYTYILFLHIHTCMHACIHIYIHTRAI